MRIPEWLRFPVWVCGACGYTTRDKVKFLVHDCPAMKE